MRNREENRVLNLVCGAVVLAASTAAFAGDVVRLVGTVFGHG